ncbi:hint module-domain-containing protein [Glomus cerebriforme]|uniref:Hint module-domain-containing protein n=1 Tax=Glomus cerebriforme TaxID=658196 RepID=A0A397TNQ2_9GLOM|nr:hint module-domain-containing protein [Glomus cerebriforme]
MTLELRSRITDPYSIAPAILIVGKTGSGKSTLANMLFKEDKFLTSNHSDSGTQICQSALIFLNDNEYNLVDTPGIFDTNRPDDEVLNEIAKSIVQCSYGIRAIIFVIAWGKYTLEQQITTDKILEFLGQEESCRHIIVVFTKCRKNQTEDRFVMEEDFNDVLKSFLNKVGNRWVISPDLEIFDKPNDPVVERHMNDLKHFIKLMPKPYTTALFERVKIAREEKLREIEAREKESGTDKTAEKTNAGVKQAKEEFKKEGGGCFSLHSKVILASSKRIEVSQLSIGDKVCCGEKDGKLIFSEIYAIVHADDQTMTQYQRIDYLNTDGTEGTLRLTPKHHLFVSQGKTIFAEDVQAYVTKLLLFNGEKLIPVIPHRVAKEWELGYIAPFTKNGKIVVDEILCSCYAVAPPYQEIINFAMIPFRFYSWIMPIPNCEKEIHPYLRYLKHGQWFLEQLDYYNAIIKRSS